MDRCNKNPIKYTCPRCNIQYCSLACYQSHSRKCIQDFQHENLMEVLKQSKPTPEMKKKTLEMLKRVEENEPIIDFEELKKEEELIAKLEKLKMKENLELSDLPIELQEDFKKAIKDGRLTNLVKIWEPWWNIPPKKIYELGKEDDWYKEISKLPKMEKLTKKEPSPKCINNLMDLLYSYIYLIKLFNNDILGNIEDFLICFEILSNTIKGDVLETIGHAIQSSLTNSKNVHVYQNLEFSISVIGDLKTILKYKLHTLRALFELHEILKKASKLVKNKKIKLWEKKVYFYLVYVNDLDDFIFNSLPNLVEKEEEEYTKLFLEDPKKEKEIKIPK